MRRLRPIVPVCAAVLFAAGEILFAPEALAQCATTGTNQTCTNPAGTTVSGGANGIFDNNTLTVTNFGTISGTTFGILANTANVGNSGSISGGVDGILANTANVNNSGTISGANHGIEAITVNVGNSGLISGSTGIISDGGSGSALINSGTIIGTNGTAIDFHASIANTLTFLPGSRIQGAILLGTGDSVNVLTGRDIAGLLTFTPNGAFSISGSGGAPFVVSGNKVATVDPTAFGMADRTLMDFTGAVSGLVESRFNDLAWPDTTLDARNAFAAPSSSGIANTANAVFANVPSAANAYAAGTGQNAIPNMTVVDRSSGIAVWSKGFVGGRFQNADGAMLSSTNFIYGGAVGLDGQVTSDLRLGAFVGSGSGKLVVDLNSQTVNTNYLFGGVYGRFNWASQYVDFAVSTGHTSNDSARTIANNLAASGYETATASYNGWFVSPELAYGYRIPLASNFLLTPIARLRYLSASFDGYSESGSAQNLIVSSRSVQDLEERLGVDLSRVDEVQLRGFLKTTIGLGMLGLERLGNTGVNTVLIGQNLSFAAPGQNSAAGAYLGINLDYRINKNLSLFAATEGTLMTDRSSVGTAKGGLKAAF